MQHKATTTILPMQQPMQQQTAEALLPMQQQVATEPPPMQQQAESPPTAMQTWEDATLDALNECGLLPVTDPAQEVVVSGPRRRRPTTDRQVYYALHEFFIKWPTLAAPPGRLGGPYEWEG